MGFSKAALLRIPGVRGRIVASRIKLGTATYGVCAAESVNWEAVGAGSMSKSKQLAPSLVFCRAVIALKALDAALENVKVLEFGEPVVAPMPEQQPLLQQQLAIVPVANRRQASRAPPAVPLGPQRSRPAQAVGDVAHMWQFITWWCIAMWGFRWTLYSITVVALVPFPRTVLYPGTRQTKALAFEAVEEFGAIGSAVFGGAATFVWPLPPRRTRLTVCYRCRRPCRWVDVIFCVDCRMGPLCVQCLTVHPCRP
jgi:hypothetical protein